MTGYDPQLRAALDGFSVPPMRAGLAAEIVRAATGDRTVDIRRVRRGAWRRGRTILFSSAALLISATAAAAAGLFGPPTQLPVVSQVIAAIAPAPARAPKTTSAIVAPSKTLVHRLATAEDPKWVATAMPAPFAVTPIRTPVERLQRLIVQRQARAAAGLPVRPLPPRVQARLEQVATRRANVLAHPMVAARIFKRSQCAESHPVIATRVAERLLAREQASTAELSHAPSAPVTSIVTLRGDLARQPAPDFAQWASVDSTAPVATTRLERVRALRQLRAQRQALRQLRRR